jgi:outer membrane immunogenic protein
MTYDWTGLYFGVNAGYGWARGTSLTRFTDGLLDGMSAVGAANLGGGMVGGQAGFNWQAGWLVFGIEADGDWAVHKVTVAAACGDTCAITDTVKIQALVTGRGRVGVAFDRIMAYATAGMAFVSASDELIVTNAEVTGNFPTISNSKVGWTAGAGVEAAFWGHWSARAEYLYVNVNGFNSSGGVAGVFVTPIIATGTVAESWRFRENLARIAVNYRFGP